VVRSSDHAIVWQGALFGAGFSPDDQHLIVADTNGTTSFTLIETSSGHTSPFKLDTLPAGFGMAAASVTSVMNTGAIVAIRRSDNSGQALFWVTWDGSIEPFDATVPKAVEEYISRANDDDTRLLWWRNAYSSSTPVDASLLGWFELDLATMTNRALPNLSTTSADCYGAPTYYKLEGGSLFACACDNLACTSLASPPAPADSAWIPSFSVSPQRGIIAYDYEWTLNRSPDSAAMAQLYDPQGLLLASFNAGWVQYDRLDQLVLTSGAAATNGPAIVSASTGTVTPIGTGVAVIIYE
jgi:hypothetical protein